MNTTNEENKPSINIVVVWSKSGGIDVHTTHHKNRKEAEDDYASASGGDEVVIGFTRVAASDVKNQELETEAGFDVIRSLTKLPPTVDVIDSLLLAAFDLGKNILNG